MRKLLILCLAAAVCLCTAAQGQVDPEPDGIGIYADTGATTSSVTADPETPIEVYLILTRPSLRNGVRAWSCGIDVPGNAVIWGWNVRGSHWLNSGQPPDFEVAYGVDPLPAEDVVPLMTFIVWLLDEEPAEFYVRGFGTPPDQYAWPFYIDENDFGEFIRLHPWPRELNAPAFCFNPDDGTPVKSATWGQVKSLYQ